MAVTVDQATLGTGNSSGAGTTTMSTTAVVASGAVIVLLAGRFNSTNSTMAASGGSLTWSTAHNVTSGSIRVYLFYAFAPSGLASSTTLTITHSGGGSADCIIGAYSLLGVDTSGTVVAFNGAGASTAGWSSGSVSGNSGNALVGGAFVDNGSVSSSTPTAPAVERIDKNVAGQSETLTLVDKLSISGSDSVAGTWNAAGSHVAIGAAFKDAAGGGGPADLPARRTLLGVGR